MAIDLMVTSFNNNINKSIGARKQEGIFTDVRGWCCKLVHLIGKDSSGLVRWNFIDFKNGDRTIQFIIAYQYIKSYQTISTIYLQ